MSSKAASSSYCSLLYSHKIDIHNGNLLAASPHNKTKDERITVRRKALHLSQSRIAINRFEMLPSFEFKCVTIFFCLCRFLFNVLELSVLFANTAFEHVA